MKKTQINESTWMSVEEAFIWMTDEALSIMTGFQKDLVKDMNNLRNMLRVYDELGVDEANAWWIVRDNGTHMYESLALPKQAENILLDCFYSEQKELFNIYFRKENNLWMIKFEEYSFSK